jgi:hypothetical protein
MAAIISLIGFFSSFPSSFLSSGQKTQNQPLQCTFQIINQFALIQNNYYYTEIKNEKTRKKPLCYQNRGFT